jgi:DNA-binding PadR family transcriptional regulator
MDDKLLLLGILRRHEMHGYQLYEFIDRDMGSCIDIKKPTAYYLLNKMAQDGWLTEEQAQEGNRPPRTIYHMTAQGEQAFQALLRQNLSSFSSSSFPGDIGLAFLDELPPTEAFVLLQQRRLALEAALQSARSAPRHQGSVQWMLDHQARHLQAELEWLDELLTFLHTRA